jgi:hypothetical protein
VAPSRGIAPVKQLNTSPVEELHVVQTPIHIDAERSMQLPTDDVERRGLCAARHQNQTNCQNKLPHH